MQEHRFKATWECDWDMGTSWQGQQTHCAGTAPAMNGMVAQEAQAKQTLRVTTRAICSVNKGRKRVSGEKLLHRVFHTHEQFVQRE